MLLARLSSTRVRMRHSASGKTFRSLSARLRLRRAWNLGRSSSQPMV